MISNKMDALEAAIEITKEAARGGVSSPLSSVLDTVYKKILELYPDAQN